MFYRKYSFIFGAQFNLLINLLTMKKLFTILTISLSVLSLSGQSINDVINYDKPIDIKLDSEFTLTGTPDTIWDYISRATNFYIYKNGDGYLAGKNGFYDEIGMVMSKTLASNQTMELNSVFFFVALKDTIGASDDLSVKVFDVSANLPTGSAKSTQSLNIGSIDTSSATAGLNSVVFNSPVSVNEDFAVSIDLTGVDDTIALLVSDPNTGDGQNEKRFYCNYNGSYSTIDALFGGFNADLCIGAIVTINTTTPPAGITNSEKELAFNTKLFPNPNSGSMTLVSFASNQNNYLIKIYDLAGKEVYSEQVFEAGTLQHPLNLSALNTGQYMLNVSTENGASYSERLFIK